METFKGCWGSGWTAGLGNGLDFRGLRERDGKEDTWACDLYTWTDGDVVQRSVHWKKPRSGEKAPNLRLGNLKDLFWDTQVEMSGRLLGLPSPAARGKVSSWLVDTQVQGTEEEESSPRRRKPRPTRELETELRWTLQRNQVSRKRWVSGQEALKCSWAFKKRIKHIFWPWWGAASVERWEQAGLE